MAKKVFINPVMAKVKIVENKGFMLMHMFGCKPAGNTEFDYSETFKDEEVLATWNQSFESLAAQGIQEIIIAVHIEETHSRDFMQSFLPVLHKQLDIKVQEGYIKNYLTVRNNSGGDYHVDNKNIFFDWTLCATFVKQRYLGNNKFVWNHTADKILFLSTAKASKLHRLIPFILLYKHHLPMLKYTYDFQFVNQTLEQYHCYSKEHLLFLDSFVLFLSEGKYTSLSDFLSSVPDNYLNSERDMFKNRIAFKWPVLEPKCGNLDDVC